MIIVIDALNKDRFNDVLDDMFQLRARVFQDRMGWDVHVENGREIDMFDSLDPAYVVSLDSGLRVVGCLRLLQTTGPHMLADVFSEILDGEPPLRSANLWESTRFCVDTARLKDNGVTNAISQVTCEVMIGALEYTIEAGISDVVTVIDPIMNRVLKRSDNGPYDYIGTPKPFGKVTAMAGLLDCTPERLGRVRAFSGIEGNVFVSDDELRARLDARDAAQPGAQAGMSHASSYLVHYLQEQISDAPSSEERHAALSLMRELIEKGLLNAENAKELVEPQVLAR